MAFAEFGGFWAGAVQEGDGAEDGLEFFLGYTVGDDGMDAVGVGLGGDAQGSVVYAAAAELPLAGLTGPDGFAAEGGHHSAGGEGAVLFAELGEEEWGGHAHDEFIDFHAMGCGNDGD